MASAAVAGLLALTTACGTSADGAADTGGVPAAAAPAAGTADTEVSGTGMKGGCDATRKIFLALQAGDTAAAETLKGRADALFEDVAAEQATKNVDLAFDGAGMASEMDFEFPEKKYLYQGRLAQQYRDICVAKHNAAALPN